MQGESLEVGGPAGVNLAVLLGVVLDWSWCMVERCLLDVGRGGVEAGWDAGEGFEFEVELRGGGVC